MTRLTIEIPFGNDLSWFFALLHRLNFRIVEKTMVSEMPDKASEARAFILNGLPARENLEAFVQEFEESRADRVLLGREN